MKTKIVDVIFSWSGASIAIGVLGFMAGIVTIFIDVSSNLSIKWFLFVILIFGSLILILLKIIHDLSKESTPSPPFETPIRYVPEENVFVIRRNENFLNNIVVGCYVQQDEIDRLAYLGVVHLVQDKVIQIKIRADLEVLKKIPTASDKLKTIVVRPVVPVTALQQLSNLENNND